MDQERSADSFTVTQLKEILKRLDLTTVGIKNELIERLNEQDPSGAWKLLETTGGTQDYVQQEYEEKLGAMAEKNGQAGSRLNQAQEMIRRLEEQLKSLQAAKEELEDRQKELTVMLEKLELSHEMEAAERTKLEQEMRAKQEERIQSVGAKDAEARSLQEEFETAELTQETDRVYEDSSATPHQHRVESMIDLVEAQRILAERFERLKELQKNLPESRDESKETVADQIHRETLRQGRDTYKTCFEIRKGNTKRCVDEFETM
ncbi:moesin-like [Nomia melanderi]|uniref:moesin-like n=1 Tax=Nomia melanderi TaxID=2448451 RepID=UPI003FCC7E41